MKKIFQHVCFLALILMSACSLEEIPNENFPENKEITTIEATTSSFSMDDLMSRVTIPMEEYPNFGTVTWAEGDTIGIYPNEGDQLSFPIVNGIGTNVCEFNGGGWALKTSKVYTAYTPFNRSYYQYMNKDALPISMLGQKQTGNNSSTHLSAYDIQIARDTAPESGKISFSFDHQVTFVRLDITAPCAGSWKSITLESTADFTTQATMDLTGETPTLTPTAQAHSVTLDLENVQTTENLQLVAYMMMLPVDLTDKELTVKLVGTNDEAYAVPANIVNNVKNFKAGTAKWITAMLGDENKLVNPFLTFIAESEQMFQMSSEVSGLEYSVNGSEWALLGTTTVHFGGELGTLRLRGKNENGTNGSTIQFGNDVPVYCNGDIRTLLNYEEFQTVNTENAGGVS